MHALLELGSTLNLGDMLAARSKVSNNAHLLEMAAHRDKLAVKIGVCKLESASRVVRHSCNFVRS